MVVNGVNVAHWDDQSPGSVVHVPLTVEEGLTILSNGAGIQSSGSLANQADALIVNGKTTLQGDAVVTGECKRRLYPRSF